MDFRTRKLRGEKSDGGLWSRNGQSTLTCPLLNNWRVSRMGLRHLINVGVGTGNNEVISIGAGQQIAGSGQCGDKMLNRVRDEHAPRAHKGKKERGNGATQSATCVKVIWHERFENVGSV